jgi:hypothetical protein
MRERCSPHICGDRGRDRVTERERECVCAFVRYDQEHKSHTERATPDIQIYTCYTQTRAKKKKKKKKDRHAPRERERERVSRNTKQTYTQRNTILTKRQIHPQEGHTSTHTFIPLLDVLVGGEVSAGDVPVVGDQSGEREEQQHRVEDEGKRRQRIVGRQRKQCVGEVSRF